MAPAAFLQRPARWLQAISRLRATHSGGPNFAYDLCVRRVTTSDRAALDLSSWRIAFNGSEPVRRGTLESFQRTFGEWGFRWTAFRPAYGLAEATLLVTSSSLGDAPVCLDVDAHALAGGVAVVRPPRVTCRDATTSLVASGSPACGATVVIADPHRHTRCPAGHIGEIWIASASVARGYWRQPQATAETFRAVLDTGEGPFLRTGDLGFVHGSQLFVTGRIKDLLIIRGLKHYPQDLELTAERATTAVRPGCSAAFALDRGGEERAAIVAEIEVARGHVDVAHLQRTLSDIRRGVTDTHQVALCAVTLVAAGSLAKTTSGKLQRYVCRDQFLSGTLQVLAQWVDPIDNALEQVAS